MRFQHVCASVLILALVLVCFGCAPKGVDQAKVREAIEAGDEMFMKAFKMGDAAALAGCYTEDGQLLPPNGDFATGKEAIQGFWQMVMDMGIKAAKLEIVEVWGMDGMAYEVGKYTLFVEEDQMADQGKYIVIWKQVDGEWKLFRDIWNSSMPAAK